MLIKVGVPLVAMNVEALEHWKCDNMLLDLLHELPNCPRGCRRDSQLFPAVLVRCKSFHEQTKVLLGHVGPKASVVLAIDHD